MLRPDAVTTTFKGAFCGIQYAIANKSSCLMTAQKAEEMLRTARTASPGFIVIQPLLARALQLQGRHAEALAELEAMLTSVGLGSEAEKWQKDVIADALRCVVELLIALGRRAEHEGYAARFIARYGVILISELRLT